MRFILAFLILIAPVSTYAEDRFITLASTTSTQNSGLYDYLLPIFTAKTGIGVRVISVGTGQAIRIAQNGDADVLLVHHRPSEDAFLAQGYGIERRDVMYNDFVIIGPKDDPAKLAGITRASDGLKAIYDAQTLFISRGDESGTHKRERALWADTGIVPTGDWYREIGAGMGAALNMAASVEAYTLSDRGTWLSFGNKGDLALLLSGDDALFNPYGIILVNPAKYPHVKIDMARTFSDWMVSAEGQTAIGAFTLKKVQLFCPNANPKLNLKTICPTSVP
ncbi:MAG: substrate-binding domain-containing protein [Amylibacter sp.]|nr:substrate-binding domain-containing protein [Amylibacter sp.]